MDPLSITANILSVTATCLRTAKLLDDLREKYKHAQMTISALCAESTVISASVSQIQSLILRNPDVIITQLKPWSELTATFDTALTGCMVVFAVLDDEIQKLLCYGEKRELGWAQKAKLPWKDDLMKELLQQLRGQHAAIGLLIQFLQIESISEIRQLLHEKNPVLSRATHQTRSLRGKHPRVKALRSVLDSHIIEEIGSSLGSDNTGATDTSFEFDDLIVNSLV